MMFFFCQFCDFLDKVYTRWIHNFLMENWSHFLYLKIAPVHITQNNLILNEICLPQNKAHNDFRD